MDDEDRRFYIMLWTGIIGLVLFGIVMMGWGHQQHVDCADKGGKLIRATCVDRSVILD